MNNATPATPALSVESEKALRPFADAVFNDNGDMTVSPVTDYDAYVNAYFAHKRLTAPNPSPAAKGGEAVRPLKAIGEEAEIYRALRGPEWCKIFDTLRDYRMSNMAWEDGEPGYPLVDLMSRVGDTVTIADGEWEMVALADEIGLALATPSPQPADAVREALEVSASKAERNRIVDYLRDLAKRVEPKSASANNFNAAADAIESGHAFPGGNPDPALASDPAPAGEAVEPVVYEYELRFIGDIRGEAGWEKRYGSMKGLAPIVETRNARPLYAHPAPEDTARLREDLERVTRELQAEQEVNRVKSLDLEETYIRADTAETQRDDARKALEAFKEALTPSGDTKADYHGEFFEEVEFPNPEYDEGDEESEDEETVLRRVYIQWETIKEIMNAIKVRASREAQPATDGGEA